MESDASERIGEGDLGEREVTAGFDGQTLPYEISM